MTPAEIDRELAAFDEKITLSELETARAQVRTEELRYQQARFILELRVSIARNT